MDYYVLETKYGITYGSATIKSLQNDNMPNVDLLVREAIQNSSDASLEQDGKAYNVYFTTGLFNAKELNSCFTGITGALNQSYPNEEYEFLEIRDSGTSGLTGTVHLSDLNEKDHGNYFKLIFDTGKQQTKENAGGNWGFGKSVYYRAGMGIVIFYSRILEEGEFKSRLIFTMMENETDDDALLKNLSKQSAGKAWWGIKVPEREDEILPITDENEIQKILDIFGLKQYSGKETGTSAIIPYLDTDTLMRNIIPEEAIISPEIRMSCLWEHDFLMYLELAIQRWYAPKVMNKHLQDYCDKKMLRAKVNKKPIIFDEMYPIFKLTQELYTTALARTYNGTYVSEVYPDIICKPVNVNNHFEGGPTSGFVAMTKIKTDVLNQGENYLTPYIYTRHYDVPKDKNETIVIFTRDPGMVIDYQIVGDWLKGVVDSYNTDEYIIAFYVPDTSKIIKPDFKVEEYAGTGLGEYLRNCEASDHKEWFDNTKMTLVKKIKINTGKCINGVYDIKKSVNIEASPNRLGKQLGKRLLPRYEKTKKNSRGGGSGTGGSGGKMANVLFEINSTDVFFDGLIVHFTCYLRGNKKSAEISLYVDSESGLIDWNTWINDIGIKFPIQIAEVNIKKASNDVREMIECPDILKISERETVENGFIKLTALREKAFSTLQLESQVKNLKIEGDLTLVSYDKTYGCTVKIK